MTSWQLSNIRFQLTSTCTATQAAGTTFTVTNDIIENQVIAATNASILLSTIDGKIIERMRGTFAAWVFTIGARGLTRAATETADSSLQKERRPGTLGKIVAFAFDNVDVDNTAAQTLAWAYTFTWNNEHNGLESFNKGFTCPVFDDATARDTAIPSPEDGMHCYLKDAWMYYDYTAGSWEERTAWSITPNASETVAGKVEQATNAEFTAGTDTWGTWASLFVVPSQVKLAITGSFTAGEDITEWNLLAIESDSKVYKIVRGMTASAQLWSITGIELSTTSRVLWCAYLTDDLAVIVYNKNSWTKIFASAVSLSRLTPTVGTEVEVMTTLSLEFVSVAAISSTTFVVTGRLGSDDKPYAVAWTVSWTTITVWSATLLRNDTDNWYIFLAKCTSTSFVAVWKDDYNAPYIVAWSVSWTTITVGTPAYLQSIPQAGPFCLVEYIKDGVVWVFYDDQTNIEYVIVEVSWTTSTVNAWEAIVIAWSISWLSRTLHIDNSRVMMLNFGVWCINVITLVTPDQNAWTASYTIQSLYNVISVDTTSSAYRDVEYLWDNKLAFVNVVDWLSDLRLRIFDIWEGSFKQIYDNTLATTTTNVSLCKLSTNQDKILVVHWVSDGGNLNYSLYLNTEKQYVWVASETVSATDQVNVKYIGSVTMADLVAWQPYYVWNAWAVATSGTKQIGVASTTTNLVLK